MLIGRRPSRKGDYAQAEFYCLIGWWQSILTLAAQVIESDDDDSKEEVAATRNGKEATATATAAAAAAPSPALNGSDELKASTKKRIRLEEMVLKPAKKTSSPRHETPAAAAAAAAAVPIVPTASAAPKKMRPTVKELLQQKREKEKDVEMKEPAAAAAASKSTSDSSNSSDSDSDSSDSDSDSGSDGEADDAKESARGESTEEVKTLPNGLSPTLLAALEDIRKAAAASSEQGKCRFFSGEVNRLLLSWVYAPLFVRSDASNHPTKFSCDIFYPNLNRTTWGHNP